MPSATPNRGYPYPLYQAATKDFPAASSALATAVDSDVGALQSYIEGAYRRPSARIATAAGQSIPASTTTAITWVGGTTDYAYGITPNLVAGGGLTLTQAGIYLISAYVTLTAPGSGLTFGMSLYLNSSKTAIPSVSRVSVRAHPTQDTWLSVSGLHYNDGVGNDNISLTVWQNSAGARTMGFKQMSATKLSTTVGGS